MGCAIDGCERGGRLVRGWCQHHYQRWYRYGDPLWERPVRPSICAIEGCGKPIQGRGWCRLHYQRWRTTGDPLMVLKPTAHTKHGQCADYANTPTYRAWLSCRARCFNPTDKSYPDYGGRGITVCVGLDSSFERFAAFMGERPEGRVSLDRIDNNASYSCGECSQCVANGWLPNLRWATPLQQAQNRRTPSAHSARRVRALKLEPPYDLRWDPDEKKYVPVMYATVECDRDGNFSPGAWRQIVRDTPHWAVLSHPPHHPGSSD